MDTLCLYVGIRVSVKFRLSALSGSVYSFALVFGVMDDWIFLWPAIHDSKKKNRFIDINLSTEILHIHLELW